MDSLPHRLERSVSIRAPRETVFRYFTDGARWAAWWGQGSTIEARPGGRVYIRHPGGIETLGEVLELAPPERIVFTYGFLSGQPIPPGASRVTIRLEAVADGTRLRLEHAFAETAPRDEHVQGWRHQLAVFSNVVSDELHAGADALVDEWYAAWSQPDAALREATLERIVSPDVRFRDRYSLVEGLQDLRPHLAAVHRFMPGVSLRRAGAVRQCQGTVLSDWTALRADGQPMGAGTNVFQLDAHGLIEDVTGVWNPA